MTAQDFRPETPIEQRILDARIGDLSPDALMLEMADAPLFIPSTGAVQPDGRGYRPVLLEQDGIVFVAVFTALSRLPSDMGPYRMQAAARHFLMRLPPGYGVIINPGCAAQILLPPDGVAALQQDLRAAQSP